MAAWASATLMAVRLLPCGKPITVLTFTSVAFERFSSQGDMAGFDADGGGVVFGSQLAAVDDVLLGQFRPEQGMVDDFGELGVGDGFAREHGLSFLRF